MEGESDVATEQASAKLRREDRLFVASIALVLAVSWGIRADDLSNWLAHPQLHFAEGVPGSGSDSYLWFRIAREILETGGPEGPRDHLRAWPEGLERGPTPAYPWLIATTSRLFGSGVYRTALVLNLVLSSLFVIPLACFGRRVGFPLAGAVAGAVGSASALYLRRTSVDRVDTDGGALFFLCLLTLGIVSLQPGATARRNALVAAATGLSLALFCRWYGQPGFWLVYSGALVLHLALNRFPTREILRLGFVFAIFANPLHALPAIEGLLHFVHFYVAPAAANLPSPLDYAHITRDISELQPLPLRQLLTGIVDPPAAAAMGLAGFALFAVLRWRSIPALLPMAALGLFSLVGPRRFGMYLAPLVGLGLGTLVELAIERAGNRWTARRPLIERLAYLGSFAAIALTVWRSGIEFEPNPTIPVRMVASLQALARKLSEDAAILASWGSGYLIADVTGAATFNDGEAPDPLVHYLFTRAIASDDPAEIERIAAILSTYGRRGLHEALDSAEDPEAAVEALLAREASTAGNVVILFSERDIVPFPSFYRTGRFDFRRGDGPETAYSRIECRRMTGRRLRCRHSPQRTFEIDLARGRLSGGTRLRRVVELSAGRVARESEHSPGANYSLVVLPRDASGFESAFLVPEAVYRTNFNQLFLLGRFDPRRFEEIHVDLPILRALRIRGPEPRNLLD